MWVRMKNIWIFAERGFQRSLVHTSNANPGFWKVRNIKEKVKEDLLVEGQHLEKRQETGFSFNYLHVSCKTLSYPVFIRGKSFLVRCLICVIISFSTKTVA